MHNESDTAPSLGLLSTAPVRCQGSLRPHVAAEYHVISLIREAPRSFRADLIRAFLHAGLAAESDRTDWFALSPTEETKPFRLDFQLFPAVQGHIEILSVLTRVPDSNRAEWIRERITAGAKHYVGYKATAVDTSCLLPERSVRRKSHRTKSVHGARPTAR